MHIGVNKQSRLRANWISQVFQVLFNSKARGVVILFSKNIPFRLCLDLILADPYGRYLMVSGHINSLPITMLNNIDSFAFFCKVVDTIPPSPNVIIGGDFNWNNILK